MDLDHTFVVPVPVEDAWPILIDVEKIVHCMPGAKLTSTQGDAFTGEVRVKIGPIAMTYSGDAEFATLDESTRTMVVNARGRDIKGSGTASAAVTATLIAQDGATQVRLHTDLEVTGRAAQFGRGMVASVSDNLIGQFAKCLAAELATGTLPSSGSTTPQPGAAPVIRDVAHSDAGGSDDATHPPLPMTTPATAPAPKRTESINGLRLVAGALGHTVMAAVKRLFRKLRRPSARNGHDGG